MSEDLSSKFRDLTSTERLEGFSLQALFSEVFKKHDVADIERQFCVGTPGTIPDIQDVDTSWPRPWMFLRALTGSVIVYLLFVFCWHLFENINLLPGLIFTGAMAIPLATVLFFFEVNVRKNVSLYQTIRLVMLGGVVSLLFSLVLFELPTDGLGWMEASIAGLIEEPGKLLALLFVAKSSQYRYKLNGLLFGACVGAGFAIFESMGYAFQVMLQADGIDEVTENILLRGVLSPGAHVVWTAIAGAALWRVKGTAPFRWSMVQQPQFWRLFLVPVVLHVIWNSGLELPFLMKYVAAGFVAWVIVLSLVQEGLKELRTEKADLLNKGVDGKNGFRVNENANEN